MDPEAEMVVMFFPLFVVLWTFLLKFKVYCFINITSKKKINYKKERKENWKRGVVLIRAGFCSFQGLMTITRMVMIIVVLSWQNDFCIRRNFEDRKVHRAIVRESNSFPFYGWRRRRRRSIFAAAAAAAGTRVIFQLHHEHCNFKMLINDFFHGLSTSQRNL